MFRVLLGGLDRKEVYKMDWNGRLRSFLFVVRVWGLWLRVYGLGFRVKGFRVEGLGFRV